MTEEKVVLIKGESKKLDTREDVADIVKQIEECEGLTTLQLSGNSFGVDAMKAIGEALVKKPELTKALWSDMFVSRLKSEIPQALIALGEGIMGAQACLTELDLSDNAFGPTGVEPIIPLLTSPSFYSIKILKFNNNGLGIKGGTFLSKALLQCHEKAESAGQRFALEEFVAGRNRLESAGARALSEVFEAMGSLVRVSMPQNGIDAEGICALANAFSKNTDLECIDLNDNTFTEVGSKSMADVLPCLQKLRVINFGDCLVRPEGGRAIAEAIKDSHPLLEEINLSYGELDQDVGLVVADALANKRALKKVDLNGNCFGEEGIELLRDSLEAKGHIDALGSLSDDEDVEHEDEDEEEEEETRGDLRPKTILSALTIEEYFGEPCGENLIALGDHRNDLFLDFVNRRREDKETRVTDTVTTFTKVTGDYHTYLAWDTTTKTIIESVVDAIVEPLFQEDLGSLLLNEILVHIGLLKPEDKKFIPVKEIEGPVQALVHIVKSNYFPRIHADILVAFFTKSSPVLKPLEEKGLVNQILQVLHTL